MVYLTLENKLYIKVDADNHRVLDLIKETFSYYVEGFQFMPRYRSGDWNGKVYVFDYKNRRLPYGLLFDLIKLLKRNRYDIKVSDEVKKLYGNNNDYVEFNYDLKYEPRYYQDEIVKECLRYKKGIFVSPTASGKSLSIAYIVKTLHDNYMSDKSLIIVPTTSLVIQFHEDLLEYGISSDMVGKFYAEEKDWDKSILISTWQSLSYNNEKIRKNEVKTLQKQLKKKSITKEEKERYQARYDLITSTEYKKRVKELMEYRKVLMEDVDCVIVDETQSAKSVEVNSLMQKISNAEYRFGCTGTLPDSKLDVCNVKSFIGPVLKHYTVQELTQAGFLNQCSIQVQNLYYSNQIKGNLNEVKDQIFNNDFRLRVIEDTIDSIDDENILILVGRVEKEGIMLENRLKERFPDKHIKFIHGKVKAKDREEWRQRCINENNIVLIAVYQLFQAGINIPNLSYVMFGSSYKAKVRTLQSIGRSLRKAEGKSDSCIIDIVDHSNKYMPKHAKERMNYYMSEGFDVIESDFYESEYGG